MNIWRLIIVGLELCLIGLDLRLIVFSCSKQHYDAVLAEISYGMFVAYAVWSHGHRLEIGPSFPLLLSAIAALLGIAGLLGIVRKISEEGVYT